MWKPTNSLQQKVQRNCTRNYEASGCIRRFKIDIIISEIVSRGDDLNVKSKAVSKYLKEMCKSKNICFLEHANITPCADLN